MVRMGGWLTDKVKDPIPVVTLCHNPVREGDNPLCGDVGYVARVGDLRKNFLFYWPYDSQAPWGGIANWNADPLTGEIRGAAANTMGRSVRWAAAHVRDVLQVAMGDMELEDIVNGLPKDMYFSKSSWSSKEHTMGLTREQINTGARALNAANTMMDAGILPLAGSSMSEKMASYSLARSRQVWDPWGEAADQAAFQSLVTPILNTKYELDRLTPAHLMHATGDGTKLNANVLEYASILRQRDPGFTRIMQETLRTRYEQRGMCFHQNEAPNIGSVDVPGLAAYFKNRFPGDDRVGRGQQIYDALLPEIYAGIALHEMGHSLGMLHQFASSYDSSNFQPQYWQLRTADGTQMASCNGEPGDNCMGPRYLDPETDDEKGLGDESRPGINYFASTSTMEYQWERFSETAGLGTYDQHAMKALYGRVLETMDEKEVSEQVRFAPRMRSQRDEQDLVVSTSKYGTFPHPVHYTELARQLNVFDKARDCRDAKPEEKVQGKWRIVYGQVCSPPPKDHAAWQDFLSDPMNPADPYSTAPFWHTPNDPKRGDGKIRWHYRFGASNAYMHTAPSDAGADPYEIAFNTKRKFEVMYPFTYFRRKSRDGISWFLPGNIHWAYFEKERRINWHVAAKAGQYYASFGPENFDDMAYSKEISDDWLRPYLLGAKQAFDMLAGAVMMPQPGFYSARADRKLTGFIKGNIFDTADYNASGFPVLPGVGRYIDTGVNSDPDGGGSWHYNEWVTRFGFDEEKSLALAALIDGRPPAYTPSRELFLDNRYNRISFHTSMPKGVERLVGGLMSNDWESIGPQYRCTDAGSFSCNAGVVDLIDLTQDTLPKRRDNAQILFPNIGYEQQSMISIFVALYSNRTTSTMALNNRARIWIEGIDGALGQWGFPEPQDQIRFENPITRFVYVARRYGTEDVIKVDKEGVDIPVKTIEVGIGAQMLTYANYLVADAYEVEKSGADPVFDEYGKVKLILDADGHPIPRSGTDSAVANRKTRLSNYVGIIDGARQMGIWFGNGPF